MILLNRTPDVIEPETIDRIELFLEKILQEGAELGFAILKALIVFAIGKVIILLLNKLVRRILTKRKIEPSVKSFLSSLINITLTILLVISVIGALGVQTTSFAALLASAGVAVGVALSGNLSNFAGGVIILLFKPFRVGDYIEAQGTGGTVREIQIFHTILDTSDNKRIFVPNGAMSSGVVTNYNNLPTRRIEWVFAVTYGEDYETVRQIVEGVLKETPLLLPSPDPFIALSELASGNVNVIVRVWVVREDYWPVYYDVNRRIYEAFKEKGVQFATSQILVSKAN